MTLLFIIIFVGCTSAVYSSSSISNIVVSHYQTNEKQGCLKQDVDLSEVQVAGFFDKAEKILAERLHDHQRAPCFTEGTLLYQTRTDTTQTQACEWKIEPLGLGFIQCEAESVVLYCSDCFAK